ncbi:MAG: hypothetical protein OJF49_003166 [Ktedonobacterales bacterium]|nr:MAG: hypothetical protein OJF49_003166 [Ktedonobacterales bacterium]
MMTVPPSSESVPDHLIVYPILRLCATVKDGRAPMFRQLFGEKLAN